MASVQPLQRHANERMAWRRGSFKSTAEYSVEFNDADRNEILAAVDAAHRKGRLTPAWELKPEDFPFKRLGEKLTRAYEEVRSGHGFVLLRGLPIEGVTLDEFMAAVWGVGTHFGHPLSQNAQGELIGHVIDATSQEQTPRMFRSNLELRLHTDVTAMISLACWHKSQEGGASFLASGITIHDEIQRRAPHLLVPLYNGFYYHRLGEEGEGEETATPYRMPVFTNRGGQISCRYQRAGLAAGHRERGVELTELELEALDLFDEVARAPEHRLAFHLERGDMVVVNNYTVLHARTKFTEYAEPEKRRHLIRLWLDAPGFRDVPPELNLFAVNGVPKQEGRTCTYDFRKLYKDDPRATGGLPSIQLSETDTAR
jgi:alpha-ketoglutarate-dependent taurine dioxygenase